MKGVMRRVSFLTPVWHDALLCMKLSFPITQASMSIRTERVAKLLQREVADILQQDFSQHLMVTVTDVRVTKDLSIAYVYVSVMGTTAEQRQATFRHLQDQNAQIRQALAGRIRHQMRSVPELKFFLDESLERAERMETLFERIRAERDHRDDDPSER